MDPTLQAKINEAKANGYTDEEINAFLGNQNTPVTANAPIDRSEEYTGLGQGMAGKAAELAAYGYAGKKLVLDPLLNAAGNALKGGAVPGPVAPTPQPSTMGNAQWDRRLAPQGFADRAANFGDKVKNIAMNRIMPVAPAAGVIGGVAAVPGAMMYDAYKNYQQQTPEQRRQSAMESLSGQGLGQAGIY